MKKYFGNYLGLCIDNNDPQKRGRVQVFIPHIMPALFENWNEVGEDIQMLCVGDNLPQSLPTPMVEKLKKILPWAEAASPILGTSAPGNLESGNYTQFPEAQCPPGTTPVPVPGAGESGLLGAATGGSLLGAATGGTNGNWAGSLPKLIDILPPGSWNPGSQKRGRVSTRSGGVSDHYSGNSSAYAIDLGLNSSFKGNSQQATNTAIQIVNNVRAQRGEAPISSWDAYRGSTYTATTPDGYRVQVIWQSNVGGNHYDHIHLGVKYVGGGSGTLSVPGVTSASTLGAGGPGGGFVCYPTSTSGQLPATNPLNSPNPLDDRASIAVPLASNTGGGGGSLSVPGVGQVGGNTQVKNFSGSQSEAFATMRAAAQRAGSPDPNITSAIAMFESGHLGSSMARRANNPFGQTITRSQIGTNGIIGGTTGADGQLHAVYNSLESAVSDHLRRWGGRYVAGSVTGTTNSLIAGGYNTQSIGGLGPGQYWANGVLNRFNALSGQTAQPATGLEGAPPTAVGGNGLPPGGGDMIQNPDGSGPAPMININNMAAGMFSYPAAGAILWVFFREGNPLFPVYFAANYGEREWASAYRLPGPGQDGVGYKPAATPENPVTSVGGTWNVGKVGVHQWHYINDPNNPLNNERSYAIGGHDGSNLAFTEGKTYLTNQFDFRSHTNGDFWRYVGGSTEEFYHGATRNINNFGDTVIRYGNTSPEAVAAAEKIVEYINQIMQPLTQSTCDSGGAASSGGPGTGTSDTTAAVTGGTEAGLTNPAAMQPFDSVASNVLNNTGNGMMTYDQRLAAGLPVVYDPKAPIRMTFPGDMTQAQLQAGVSAVYRMNPNFDGSNRVSINNSTGTVGAAGNLPARGTPIFQAPRTTIPPSTKPKGAPPSRVGGQTPRPLKITTYVDRPG